jgi:hypothetical protein
LVHRYRFILLGLVLVIRSSLVHLSGSVMSRPSLSDEALDELHKKLRDIGRQPGDDKGDTGFDPTDPKNKS